MTQAGPQRQGFNVSTILEDYKKGFHRDYDTFLSKLADPDVETEELWSYLRGIKNCVTLLDKDFEVLIGVLLKLDWVYREQAIIFEYQSCILNLVSAHTYYLRASLRMLVKLFTPRFESIQKEDASVSDEIRKKQDKSFINVHMVLRAVCQLVPMAPNVLTTLLNDMFPHMIKPVYTQECYVRNILQVTHYVPSLRRNICELVVDRMIKLDVRSPRHEIKESQRDEEDMDEDDGIIFDMEDTTAPTTDNPAKYEIDKSAVPMFHVEGDKLDVMMDMLMKYFDNICHKDGELDWEATKLLYREILLVFERIILPTHASCHVQFIMFYLCSLKQPLFEGFLDYLWKKVQDPNTQSVFRQAAVGYIGSMLSRAGYITMSTVTTCMDLMCMWVHKYLDKTGEDTVYSDLAHHGPFYSVCQSIFYVFVFRSKEIFEMKRGYKWAESLNFQRIVTSRLNPLRVCLPVIVKTFASVTRMHQIAFCDTIIERNKRCMLPVATDNSGATTSHTVLDSFFPFDPYLLKRSQKFILPIYKEYHGCVEEEEMSSSDDDEDDFITEDTANVMATSGSKSLSKTPIDFMRYGVSPGFKTLHEIT